MKTAPELDASLFRKIALGFAVPWLVAMLFVAVAARDSEKGVETGELLHERLAVLQKQLKHHELEGFAAIHDVSGTSRRRWLWAAAALMSLVMCGMTLRTIHRELVVNGRMQRALLYSSKMSALGEMAGSLAHELNNPLAIISGHSQRLEKAVAEGTFTPRMLRDGLERIDSLVMRAAKIIQGLREFSRDGGKDPAEAIPVGEILERTVELCGEAFRAQSVRLEVAPDDPKLLVECRPVQISQVLLNLLSNGLDAARASDDKWVRVTTRTSYGAVEFRVEDSGRGIPRALREKIMEPFFTTKGTGKGTGLGLSISKGLMESHRGSLYLDSKAPQTTFVARLPRPTSEPAYSASYT